eukprot:Gregarina_sp_Pseudo_9__4256@NODE_440_length_2826_cov_5_725152_g416_i0_p2_GENE_NODE_440_length_2826_cov_5_725152_g416_i0NODE_440_length_2826_cov_5_725152_g416_i0_p2_ORF_typecomplete_len202_score18_72PspA_IM30/PF04012_12/0_053CCDC158/PF15921_5/0_076LUC7/PF03194_15/0_14_NODE_440_length_2826_cov_5_725152_g416_i0354959
MLNVRASVIHNGSPTIRATQHGSLPGTPPTKRRVHQQPPPRSGSRRSCARLFTPSPSGIPPGGLPQSASPDSSLRQPGDAAPPPPQTIQGEPGPSLVDQARHRLSSLSSEMQDLTRRASSAMSAGHQQEAQSLLSQAEQRTHESHGILGWLRTRSQPSSLATRTTRTVVHTIIPPPCRWGIYCCARCCCCCCYPPQLDQVL